MPKMIFGGASSKNLALGISIGAAALFLAGCGNQQPASTGGANQTSSSASTPVTAPVQDQTPATAANPSTPSNQTANAVTIKNFSFSPATLTVAKGTKVTWTNEDSAPHQIVSDSGSAVTISGTQMSQGQSFSFTFDTAGTFSYHCNIHPSMLGKIVVQ